MLSEILRVEIPNDAKAAIDSGRRKANKPIVVLILCQDSRTCYQLNQYLTQGAEKYLLFTAMKNDIPIKKLSEAYKSVKESDINSIRLHGSQLQNETIKVILRTIACLSTEFVHGFNSIFLMINSLKPLLRLQRAPNGRLHLIRVRMMQTKHSIKPFKTRVKKDFCAIELLREKKPKQMNLVKKKKERKQ